MKLDVVKNKIYQKNMEKTGYKCNFDNPEWRRKYNRKTSKIEKHVCSVLNGEPHFIYQKHDYDFKIGNDVFEIEGDFYHPIVIEDLTLIQIGSLTNDYKKYYLMKDSEYTLYKILVSKIPKIITIESLKEIAITPNYIVNYDTIIINKYYLYQYILKRGKDKLIRFPKLLLKFIRTFQPTFPDNDIKDETIINRWFDDNEMIEVIKYIIGLNEENIILDFSLKEIVYQLIK